MNKVLVTGGAGYVGSVLISELIQRGRAIKVYDKLYFGKEHLKDSMRRIELIQGDIRHFDKSHLDEVSDVIHLAALSNDPTAEFNPKANDAINTEGTRILAEACLEKGINKFIFASSASIYDKGLRSSNGIQDEKSEVEPIAAYSTSKHNAENILLGLGKNHPKFCPIIVRKGTIYGQSPRMRYDLVINTLVKNAFIDSRLKVNCGGNQWRPLVDIKDVARAYVTCLDADEKDVRGEIFNVSYGNFQIWDVAHRIKDAIKDIQPVEVDIDYSSGIIDRSYSISNKKLEEKLGFRYQVPIESSAREMALKIKNDLDKGKIKKADLGNPIYYNIKWLELLTDIERRLKEMGGVF